jgi:hypothetical protein
VNLLLAICLGICMSSHTVTPEQRDAAELLSILEYLGGIEDDAKWEELRHTLGDAKVSAGNAAASTTQAEGLEAASPPPVETARKGVDLVEAAPADAKGPARCADLESC